MSVIWLFVKRVLTASFNNTFFGKYDHYKSNAKIRGKWHIKKNAGSNMYTAEYCIRMKKLIYKKYLKKI